MNKIKKVFIFIILIIMPCMFCACTLQDIENFLLGKHTTSYTVESIEELTADEALTLLLSTREKIRSFNVYIETYLYNTFGHTVVQEETNLGSGIIIAKSLDFRTYYVITNSHVIATDGYSNVRYTIETISGTNYAGTLLFQDTINDMAILSFTSLESLTLANLTNRLNKPLTENEFLLAVGNPSGVKNTVTYGKYLGDTEITNVEFRVIHHNVLIKPGNSGGALTDINGNVVGINTWGTTGDDEDNYSISLSQVKIFLTEAQKNIVNLPTVM